MILTNPVIRDAERRAGKVSELGAAFACASSDDDNAQKKPYVDKLMKGGSTLFSLVNAKPTKGDLMEKDLTSLKKLSQLLDRLTELRAELRSLDK